MQAFVGDGHSSTAAGNPCLVLHGRASFSSAEFGHDDITRCATWQTAPREAQVQCWTGGGKSIQCCGHGLLCCAALWTTQWQGDGALHMGQSRIPCRRNDAITWLAFERMAIQGCPVEDWMGSVLGQRPQQCALTDANDGYLVAEMSDNCALESLRKPEALLAQYTQRALIVTRRLTDAALQSSQGQQAIEMRYFAPQYGVNEDIATGSAMRVLAQYWQQRGAGSHLLARQCSTEGGLLLSTATHTKTWIGGQVHDAHLAAEEAAHV